VQAGIGSLTGIEVNSWLFMLIRVEQIWSTGVSGTVGIGSERRSIAASAVV
jgi:hypothetical protein